VCGLVSFFLSVKLYVGHFFMCYACCVAPAILKAQDEFLRQETIG